MHERMGTLRRGEAPFTAAGGPRRRALPFFVVLVSCGVVLLFAAASSASGPSIEAAGGGYGYGGYYWNPSSAEVAPGGTVSFKNASGVVMHGVSWTSGPESPSCSGVPKEGKTSWSGSCSFAQAGTYKFICPVHPTEMTGTITVSSGGTTTPPPPPGESPPSLLNGPPRQAVRLARSQHGATVRGSVDLAQAGAGGRLEVDLLTGRASLRLSGPAGTVRVGRLLRSGLRAGLVPFAVSLKAPARRALRRHGRLALTVRLIITPAVGEALKLTRGLVLHA